MLLSGLLALALGLALLQAQPEADGSIVHTVEAGDTLISIALAYGVTLDQLLTLNDLQLESILQIGQRLLVIPAPENRDERDEAEALDASGADADEATENDGTVGGNILQGGMPPAPVIEADAPLPDPADTSPQLCVAVFLDDNQNGMRERGEALLPAATIRLLDADASEPLHYASDGGDEPYCERNLERKQYRLEVLAPPGFGLTSGSRLRIDLRSGGRVQVEIGAKQGLAAGPLPALAPASGDRHPSEERRSPLRELSAVFALGLAAIVFFSGMALSLFIRGR